MCSVPEGPNWQPSSEFWSVPCLEYFRNNPLSLNAPLIDPSWTLRCDSCLWCRGIGRRIRDCGRDTLLVHSNKPCLCCLLPQWLLTNFKTTVSCQEQTLGDCWIGCGLAGTTVTPSDLFRLLPFMMIISLWAAWRAAVDDDIFMFLVWKCSSAPAYLPDLPSVALILCSVRQYGLSVRFWLW